MDARLLDFSNCLFYGGLIKSGYKAVPKNFFLRSSGPPMLFINSKNKENEFGNSYCNTGDANIVADLLTYLTTKVKHNNIHDFGIVSPY